jgi:hypothetical protein
MSDEHSRDHGTADDNSIGMYLGPYERWNFGAGRPYTLPFVRNNWTYISALAELGSAAEKPHDTLEMIKKLGWLPTFWMDALGGNFVPFVAYNPLRRMPKLKELIGILQKSFVSIVPDLLQAFHGDATPASTTVGPFLEAWLRRVPQSRFRVAFPVAERAMHPQAGSPPKDPVWWPDAGLRRRIGKKRITVIAVIDDGLPFAHRNFRDKTGTRTRVEFCWLQSAAFNPAQKSVLFGREYIRTDIEELIAQHGDDEDALYYKAGATKETEGLGSLLNRQASHGAHVMDLAAGYAPERGRPAPDGTTPDEEPREEIRIIAVQLPNTIAWDTSGFGKDMYMLSAFHYIFHRADILAKGYEVEGLRLVVNFSYGFSGGRHDGETELEAAIDELVCKRRTRKPRDSKYLGPSPTALVLPSGNTFLDRLHAEIVDEDFTRHGNVVEIPWRIQPNDRTSSYLELWFWGEFSPDQPFGFTIALRDPDGNVVSLQDNAGEPKTSLQVGADQGTTVGYGDPGRMYTVLNPQRQVIGQLSADMHRYNTPVAASKTYPPQTGRWRVLVVIAPTEPEDPRLPRAASGKWTIVIQRTIAALIDYPIHCWIQRSADPESLRSGSKQSYFDEWAYERTRYTTEGDLSERDTEGTFVQRFGSLNGLATGRTALVVGGFRLGAGLASPPACARPARYSSAGVLPPEDSAQESYPPPCPSDPREAALWPEKQVDASSMSERSRALPGTIAAGVRSGSLSLVQGTSSAAPFVARRLAERFVEASNREVDKAASENYRPLLDKYGAEAAPGTPISDAPTPRETPAPSCVQDNSLIRARLGKVRVPPHWQPGV